MNEIAEESIEDVQWLQKTKAVLKQFKKDVQIQGMFQCELMLPLNSPLRGVTVGKVMPSKCLAKRSTALQVCVQLHEINELDDAHLLPVEQVLEPEELLGQDCADEQTAEAQFYERHLPRVFQNCRPRSGIDCFVYHIKWHSTELERAPVQLAILSSLSLPQVCQFPLTTRSGEIQVELSGVDVVVLDHNQIDRLVAFHQFLFQEVIFLFKEQLTPNVDDPQLQPLIVPLTVGAVPKIDFEFVDRMISAPKIDWDRVPTEPFTFHAERYIDAVVVPWYKPLGKLLTYYVDSVSELTCLSPFPGNQQFDDFRIYFLKKYKLKLTDCQQSLLQCSREITGKNFLIPRYTGSENKITLHVPELVFVHALPASVWKQTVLIPSVLHRLNGLFVAEELRLDILRQAGIGIECLPLNGPPWKPMHRTKKTPPTTSLPTQFRPLNLDAPKVSSQRKLDVSINADSMWDVDLFDETLASVEDLSLSDCDSDRVTDVDIAASCNPKLNLSFDRPDPRDYCEFGPSPGYILEALTMARADDGFSMERLETIGDSFLKLAASMLVYGQSKTRNFDEGQLSKMRSFYICNKHLCYLGLKVNQSLGGSTV